MVALRYLCALLLATGGAVALLGPATARQATAVPHAAPPADAAAPEMRIAAVVNDEVISVFDLISRIRMVLLSSNLPDSEETRKKIGSQVVPTEN